MRKPLSGRTTFKVLLYFRKLEAVNQYSKLFAFGLPKLLTRSASEVIVTTLLTGPFSKGPAIAPIVVSTLGTTLVKSIS